MAMRSIAYPLNVIKLLIPLCELSKPFSQAGGGFKAVVAFQGFGVGEGYGYVAGLHGYQLLVGFEVVVFGEHTGTDQFLLQNVDKVEQVFGVLVSDVVYSVGRHGQAVFADAAAGGSGHNALYTFYDVVYVGKVSLAVAVVKDLNGLALQQLIGKAKVSHVGSAGGSVNSKETKAGRGNVVQLGVGMSHQLVALFGCCVKAYRVIDLVVGRVRNLLVGAIHRAGGGIYQMLYPLCSVVVGMSASLQNVVEADHVALDIGIGIGDGIAYASLCRQVYNNVGMIFIKDGIDGSAVGNIALDKGPGGFRMSCCRLFDLLQAPFLDG